MSDRPFFTLIEERSPEEIAEEMEYAFGPSKGYIRMFSAGLFEDEPISSEVLEAMERMIVEMQNNICFPRHLVEITNTSPNRLYVSSPAGVSSIP